MRQIPHIQLELAGKFYALLNPQQNRPRLAQGVSLISAVFAAFVIGASKVILEKQLGNKRKDGRCL
jgi:hypothetical protein